MTAYEKISQQILLIKTVDPDQILKNLIDSTQLLQLPFLAPCIPGALFQDNRVNVRDDYLFPFLGRRALKDYIVQVDHFSMSTSPGQMELPITSDDDATKMIVTGISGSGKSFMTAALVYYLTCCKPNTTCRIIYIASVMAFIKHPLLYLKCAFKIAFHKDLNSEDKKRLKNCTDYRDLIAFLRNLKQRLKIGILFVVDQFNAFDTEKYMKEASFESKDRSAAKLMLKAVMIGFKRVLIMSPSDDCATEKSGNDDLLSEYLDLSKPMEYVSSCYALCSVVLYELYLMYVFLG